MTTSSLGLIGWLLQRTTGDSRALIAAANVVMPEDSSAAPLRHVEARCAALNGSPIGCAGAAPPERLAPSAPIHAATPRWRPDRNALNLRRAMDAWLHRPRKRWRGSPGSAACSSTGNARERQVARSVPRAAARFERRISTNRKLSALPTLTTLESFDFAAQPEVPKPTVDELATLRVLHQGENVLLLGPCGVGKTHLATGLALTALARGHRIYFMTLHDLVTKSRAARDRNRLGIFMQMLLRPALLILDEIGYHPLERHDATCLFELVNKRYQLQKSIILTSNKSFGQWDEIFPDTALATALLDRLLHRATTITIRGESYRLRHRRQAGLAGPPLNAGGIHPAA
jgi:DNA replication protein DnaC